MIEFKGSRWYKCDLAHTDGAIVISAHIDEYNGLGSVSVANLNEYLLEYVMNVNNPP